jgi:hypothetical protein
MLMRPPFCRGDTQDLPAVGFLLLQDFTRAHSQAGIITKLVYEYYGDKVKDILPALGSHVRNPSIALQNMPRSANHGLAHRTR